MELIKSCASHVVMYQEINNYTFLIMLIQLYVLIDKKCLGKRQRIRNDKSWIFLYLV